jgi:hypothetical protein
MHDIERLNMNIYSIALTKNENGFTKYLDFISSRNDKFSKFAIKVNLRIDYIYRNKFRHKRPCRLLKKWFHSKMVCCGIFFEKETKYLGYLDCFYVYDLDHIIPSGKIYRLKYIGAYIDKLPENVDRGYFEKEAKEYQKYDIYFIRENNLFVFNNAEHDYKTEEIDNILGRLEFVTFDFHNEDGQILKRQLIQKGINDTERAVKKHKLLAKYKIINQMSGIEFERFCKDILVNYEWLVNTTRASGDHGVDIIARKKGKDIAIQCKNYTNKMVNNRAIQEVYTGCHFYDLDLPVIVTNIGFTKQAIQEAEKLDVKLFDIEHFFYFASEYPD